MCGIAGIWDFRSQLDLNESLYKMISTLEHRGPDNRGLYIDPDETVALGHQRLSIIDLSSAANQPMINEDGTLVIVFNGEVYNFLEIKHQLTTKGYKFVSNSDTEVILKSYQEWGMECVNKFIGMFAFAIWDRRKRKIFLCRDRIGVKPLYFYFHNWIFMFASELKAFLKVSCFKKAINLEVIPQYLQLGYISSPQTIFQNIHKLMPGHYLEIDKSCNMSIKKYWDITSFYLEGVNLQKSGYFDTKKEEEIFEELESLMVSAFSYRLVSDVPVGVFLSGGVDSTAVTALLHKYSASPIKTFTIGFTEKSFNEAQFAKNVANYLGTEHYEEYCTPQDVLKNLDCVIKLFDEPFADSSAIPTYMLSKMARKHVKVALSADGGDELFWGYSHYPAAVRFYNLKKKLPNILQSIILFLLNNRSEKLLNRAYNFFSFWLPYTSNPSTMFLKLKEALASQDMGKIFEISRSCFFPDQISDLLSFETKNSRWPIKDVFNLPEVSQIPLHLLLSYVDFKTYFLDDILTKVDRCTMGVSLEGREPFLDHRLIEYVIKLPWHYKYRNGVTKFILKKILYRYVPRELIERPKQGFIMPIHIWFRKELAGLYKEYLNKDKLKKEGIFNPDAVEKILTQYLNGKPVHHSSLWSIFLFEKWLEIYG